MKLMRLILSAVNRYGVKFSRRRRPLRSELPGLLRGQHANIATHLLWRYLHEFDDRFMLFTVLGIAAAAWSSTEPVPTTLERTVIMEQGRTPILQECLPWGESLRERPLPIPLRGCLT